MCCMGEAPRRTEAVRLGEVASALGEVASALGEPAGGKSVGEEGGRRPKERPGEPPRRGPRTSSCEARRKPTAPSREARRLGKGGIGSGSGSGLLPSSGSSSAYLGRRASRGERPLSRMLRRDCVEARTKVSSS